MKILLEKTLEVIPNPKEVCSKMNLDWYYNVAKDYDAENNIRYIDIIALLLGGIGAYCVQFEYKIYKTKDKNYIQLLTSENVNFELDDNLNVESDYYNVLDVIQCYEFMKEFNLLEQ